MRHKFFVKEKLGPKQSLTPEGFLLCEDVPLARTGMMVYGPNETPIAAGPDGIVKIFREPEDVFTNETISSAQGKSYTIGHPEDDVTPVTWKDVTHGFMINVRRGEAGQDDLMLGDLLITTDEGIKAIREKGIVEVSLGYDAEYEELGPGVGKQKSILINHVAGVPQGRYGSRCSIGDNQTDLTRTTPMAAKSAKKFLDFLNRAHKAKDAAEVEELAKQADEEFGPELSSTGDTHIHVHGMDNGIEPISGVNDAPDLAAHIEQNAKEHAEMLERITALEAALKSKTSDEEAAAAAAKEKADKEAADKAKDEEMEKEIMDEVPEQLREGAAKANDSAYLADSFQETAAMAEILVPGIRIPTFDKAAGKVDTYKAICTLRRQALDLAYAQPTTRGILDELLAGKELDSKSMTCDAARTLFRSAAAMKRNSNNAAQNNRVADKGQSGKAGVTSLAELNRLNAERYRDA